MDSHTAASTCPVCGKLRYYTRRDARQAAQHLAANGYGRMYPYKCNGFFHLTSANAKRRAWYRERGLLPS
jgi:hypothetical protein